jgi:hypothetical protein
MLNGTNRGTGLQLWLQVTLTQKSEATPLCNSSPHQQCSALTPLLLSLKCTAFLSWLSRTPRLSRHTPVCDKAAVVPWWKKTGSVYPHLILFKELWCISHNGKEIFFSRPSTWALGPFWSPLQRVPEAPFPLVKWSVHYDNLSPPSSVKLRMCGATTSLSHTPSEWAEGKLLSLLLHLILRTTSPTETEKKYIYIYIC